MKALTDKEAYEIVRDNTSWTWVFPEDVKYIRGWIFHRTRECDTMNFHKGKEPIDCYPQKGLYTLEHNGCPIEPWSGCDLKDSPFKKNNDNKVLKTLERLDKSYQKHLYDQTEEGQLEKRQEKAVSKYLNNIIQNDKEFKNKCWEIRCKIQDQLDKKYGKYKKFALGIGVDDMRKANLITPEMEARMQEIRKEVV